jgi:predicted SpoU family rRNA methylase
MKIIVKNDCLSVGKVHNTQLSEKAMGELRQSLIGEKVFLGIPVDDTEQRRVEDWCGNVIALDGNDLVVRIFKNSTEKINKLLTVGLVSKLDFIGEVDQSIMTKIRNICSVNLVIAGSKNNGQTKKET